MIISILRLVTQGIGYALVVFIPSVILLCPPIIKFIQKKTRIKKVLLFIIISVSLMDKNIFLSAKLETEMSFQPFCKAGLIPTY